MPNSCEVTLKGHAGSDAEAKKSTAGNDYAQFSVAISNGKKDDPNKVTTWFKCMAFKSATQQALTVVSKGAALVVTGDLSLKAYIDKEGKPRVDATVFAHKIELYEKPKLVSQDDFDFGN